MKIKRYRGAGILFWRRTADGKVEILLGLRSAAIRHAPGQWSNFGGGRHRDETAWEAAAREAREETCVAGSQEPFVVPYFHISGESRTWVPFVYDFTTYFVEVRQQPAGWPTNNWEHETVAWFPLEELPRPLHPQAAKLIKKVPQ